MAKLIAQGTTAAPVTDFPLPEPLTLGRVRQTLGTKPGETVCYDLPRGRRVFARRASPELVGVLKANMRASLMSGHLIYGPALLVEPTDPIDLDPVR
jgi:hypothetical protein